LIEVIVITLLAVMAFAEGWEDIEKCGNAPENWACFRKTALTVARTDKESKDSVKSRMKQMAWSDDYFKRPLFHSSFASETLSKAPPA
jgi:hypothetical protein